MNAKKTIGLVLAVAADATTGLTTYSVLLVRNGLTIIFR